MCNPLVVDPCQLDKTGLLCKCKDKKEDTAKVCPPAAMSPSPDDELFSSQGRTYGFTPVITFDQPLWWKSMKTRKSDTTNELSSIVLKLGGFHLMMSFVGCIGHLMEGSGLKEVLELVYATGAVPHILSGKVISRAVRAHILVSSAIYAHLLEEEQATLTSLD
ncbi:hypothetical protein QYM36_006318, partial [Artemia franciscana]